MVLTERSSVFVAQLVWVAFSYYILESFSRSRTVSFLVTLSLLAWGSASNRNWVR